MLLFLVGCETLIGFPDASNYEGEYVEETDDYFLEQSSCILEESEPNNFEDLSIGGTLLTEDRLTICGYSSSGGANYYDGTYTGDFDFYVFEILSTTRVSIELTWSDSANLDFHFFNADNANDTIYGNAASYPERDQKTFSPGYYFLLVVSQDYASDYKVEIETEKD